MKVGIIGGGASGLMLASYLNKNKSYEITIFEKNKSLARKLLASGNGRANICNLKATHSDYNNPSFVKSVFDLVNHEDVLEYFKALGLFFYADSEGRVYPLSESSQSVLNVLEKSIEGIKTICSTKVERIIKKNQQYFVNDFKEGFDYVIIASGSKASIEDNKINDCYNYLKDLGINITSLKNSLCGLKVSQNIFKLSGLRVQASVKLINGKDEIIHCESGEILFKDEGISGIVIMNCSSYYARSQDKCHLEIDLLPMISEEEINKFNTINEMSGLIHPKLLEYLRGFNIKTVKKLLKRFTLNICETYESKFSQVTNGGIELSQLNSDLSLKKNKNMFCIGESLDIDGICGGYNLLFAFATAILVARKIENENTVK